MTLLLSITGTEVYNALLIDILFLLINVSFLLVSFDLFNSDLLFYPSSDFF